MLDKLPPILRDAVLLMLVAPLGVLLWAIASAVTAAGGISALDWAAAARHSLDVAAVSWAGGAVIWAGLVVSPITTKYGVGAPPGMRVARVTSDPPREDRP